MAQTNNEERDIVGGVLGDSLVDELLAISEANEHLTQAEQSEKKSPTRKKHSKGNSKQRTNNQGKGNYQQKEAQNDQEANNPPSRKVEEAKGKGTKIEVEATPDSVSAKVSGDGEEEAVYEAKQPGDDGEDSKESFFTSLNFLLSKASIASKELGTHLGQCLYMDIFYKMQKDSLASKTLYKHGSTITTSAREGMIASDIKHIHPSCKRKLLQMLIEDKPYRDVLEELHKEAPFLELSSKSFEELKRDALWFGLTVEAISQISLWSEEKLKKIGKGSNKS